MTEFDWDEFWDDQLPELDDLEPSDEELAQIEKEEA